MSFVSATRKLRSACCTLKYYSYENATKGNLGLILKNFTNVAIVSEYDNNSYTCLLN